MADTNEFIWREVSYDMWTMHVPTEAAPSRRTFYGARNVCEIAEPKPVLPTNRGAIVAPAPNSIYSGYNPYVLGNDDIWYELNAFSEPTEEPNENVQQYLDEGWVVAFAGIDD